MKLKIAVLLMLFMSVAARAMDMPDENTFLGLLFWVGVFLFMTPIGWGALIIIIYVIVTRAMSAAKTAAATDRSCMGEEEKEVVMKRELRTAYRSLKEDVCD